MTGGVPDHRGECLVTGGVPGDRGEYLVTGAVPGHRGGVLGHGGVPGYRVLTRYSPLPVNRITDRCKNITFATSLRTVKTWLPKAAA